MNTTVQPLYVFDSLTCKPNEAFADVAVLPVDARPVVLTGL